MAVPIPDKFSVPGGPCGKSEENKTMSPPPRESEPGIIVYWTGTVEDIPDGWFLCDGLDNITGTALNLTINHPFNFTDGPLTGEYRRGQLTGISDPHNHDKTGENDGLGYEGMSVSTTSDFSNIIGTSKDGEHSHGIETSGGLHHHLGGHHGHKYNAEDAPEALGAADPASIHGHDSSTTTAAPIEADPRPDFPAGPNHSAEEVTFCVAGHEPADQHTHNFDHDHAGDHLQITSANVDPGAFYVSQVTNDNTNVDFFPPPSRHQWEGVGLAHDTPHTHEVGTDPEYNWVHSHQAELHTHDVELLESIHLHYAQGDHDHTVDVDSSGEHDHGITDKKHDHDFKTILIHSHGITVHDDDGHEHEIEFVGVMLLPIENVDSMPEPTPGRGNITPYTCSPSEDRRNFARCIDPGDGLPIGVIIFWPWRSLLNTIPSGFGVADGVSNASGSGFALTGYLIVHTKLTIENGELFYTPTIPGGIHSHTITVIPELGLTDELEPEVTGITDTEDDGIHIHESSFGEDGGEHRHTGGHHGHPGYVESQRVKTSSDGNHSTEHAVKTDGSVAATSVYSESAHTATEVAACFEDHADHDHFVIRFSYESVGGSTHNLRSDDTTEGVREGEAVLGHFPEDTKELDHAPHVHTASFGYGGDHYHYSNYHTHPMEVDDRNSGHVHFGGKHGHDIKLPPSESHPHPITDPGHTHTIEISAHSHVAIATEEMHEHDPVLPGVVALIPIEKLS